MVIVYFCIGMYLRFQTQKFRTQVLFALTENVTNIHCVPYDYLGDQYKEKVARKQYDEATTPEEVLAILKAFNEVPHSIEPTTALTTDGFWT